METMLIQLTNRKADKLLRELEELHIIKVLKKNMSAGTKLSERFAGKLNLSEKEYNRFQKYIHDSRSEWDKQDI